MKEWVFTCVCVCVRASDCRITVCTQLGEQRLPVVLSCSELCSALRFCSNISDWLWKRLIASFLCLRKKWTSSSYAATTVHWIGGHKITVDLHSKTHCKSQVSGSHHEVTIHLISLRTFYLNAKSLQSHISLVFLTSGSVLCLVIILKISVLVDLATPVVTGGKQQALFNTAGPRVLLDITHGKTSGCRKHTVSRYFEQKYNRGCICLSVYSAAKQTHVVWVVQVVLHTTAGRVKSWLPCSGAGGVLPK